MVPFSTNQDTKHGFIFTWLYNTISATQNGNCEHSNKINQPSHFHILTKPETNVSVVSHWKF